MPRLFAAILALPLALTLGHGRAVAEEVCHLGQVAALDLVGDELGAPTVAGAINGKSTRFILDTASTLSSLSVADSRDLPREAPPSSLTISDITGTPLNALVKAREPMLGSVKLPPMQFVAARMSMIGGNVLSAFDFEIDPIERTASLFAHKSCGGPSVVWPHQDLAIIPFSSRDKPRILLDVVLDGQKVRAVIETGSTQSILAGPVARNRFDLVMGEDGTEASGNWRTITGRNIYEFRHQFESLDLGGVEIRHPWIKIATLRHRLGLEGDGPALILGMDILSHFHIYIAYKEHNLYLTTIQGDLAAGRKPPEGQSPSNRQARWNARNLVETAWNAEAAGQPTEAASALDQAVALTPDDPEALLARARFRLGRNDIAGATADQDHALAVAPQSPQSHEIRGLILANAGRTDDGIAELSRSVELTPGNSGPLMVRAQIYLSTGQFDLALADCTAALADSPGSSKILETRGLVNLKAARPDAAITDYDAALEGNPKSARALYGRSLAKRAKGDTSGADADLAAARAIRPDIERAFGS